LNELNKTWVVGGPVMGFTIEFLKKGKSGVEKTVANAMGDVERELAVLAHDRSESSCDLFAE
jgi:hypothetical protein